MILACRFTSWHSVPAPNKSFRKDIKAEMKQICSPAIAPCAHYTWICGYKKEKLLLSGCTTLFGDQRHDPPKHSFTGIFLIQNRFYFRICPRRKPPGLGWIQSRRILFHSTTDTNQSHQHNRSHHHVILLRKSLSLWAIEINWNGSRLLPWT